SFVGKLYDLGRRWGRDAGGATNDRRSARHDRRLTAWNTHKLFRRSVLDLGQGLIEVGVGEALLLAFQRRQHRLDRVVATASRRDLLMDLYGIPRLQVR